MTSLAARFLSRKDQVGMQAAEQEFREELLAMMPPATWWFRPSDGSSWLTEQEAERRRLGAARSALLFSCIPWHAQRAASNQEYWHRFYESHMTW